MPNRSVCNAMPDARSVVAEVKFAIVVMLPPAETSV